MAWAIVTAIGCTDVGGTVPVAAGALAAVAATIGSVSRAGLVKAALKPVAFRLQSLGLSPKTLELILERRGGCRASRTSWLDIGFA